MPKRRRDFVSVNQLSSWEAIKIGIAIGICLVGAYIVLRMTIW